MRAKVQDGWMESDSIFTTNEQARAWRSPTLRAPLRAHLVTVCCESQGDCCVPTRLNMDLDIGLLGFCSRSKLLAASTFRLRINANRTSQQHDFVALSSAETHFLSCIRIWQRSGAGKRKRTICLIKAIAVAVQGDAGIHLICCLMKRFLSIRCMSAIKLLNEIHVYIGS